MIIHRAWKKFGDYGRFSGCRSEYLAFRNALYRCDSPQHRSFAAYGGRGIKFRFKSFIQFMKHLGPKPSPYLMLDRIDNDGHYEIGNVRWATRIEQSANKRRAKQRREIATKASKAAAEACKRKAKERNKKAQL